MVNLVKSTTDKSDKNRWATTWECFERAQELFGAKFILDVAAEVETSKCDNFFGPPNYEYVEPMIGTKEYWDDPVCTGIDALLPNNKWDCLWWCNPPFDLKREFITKAIEQSKLGHSGMMLLPYEPCTKWFRELVMPNASAVYVPDGRYNFLETDGVTRKSGVNFPSCFVLFTPHYNGGEAKIINIAR